MANKRKGRNTTQSKLTSAGGKFLPMLKKMAHAVGKYIDVPGSYWERCTAADKDKIFKCIVVEFVTGHDFGGGFKSSAFKVCVCSLAPGSPVVFVLRL